MSDRIALKAGKLLFWIGLAIFVAFSAVRPVAVRAAAATAASGTPAAALDPKLDSDGDGYPDAVEIDWGYDPHSTSTRRLPQKIEVNLAKQQMIYYVGGVARHQFTVSTGRPSLPTPPGDFKIIDKSVKAWSPDYKLWMPYWSGLGGNGIKSGSIGIHELPIWPSGYQEVASHLGQRLSHGCIRLSASAAQYVYAHAPVGTEVIVD